MTTLGHCERSEAILPPVPGPKIASAKPRNDVLKALLAWALLSTSLLFGSSLHPPGEDEARLLLTKELKDRGEILTKRVKRIGKETVELEAFFATDADVPLSKKILGDIPHYGDWCLKRINQRPGGGEFYLKVKSLKPDPGHADQLLANLLFDFPLFKKEMDYTLKVAFEARGKLETISGEVLPKADSPFQSVEAFVELIPAPGQPDWIWGYVKGRAVFSNWLLYEALPDKVIERQTAVRFQTLIDNYHTEEGRRKPVTAGPAGTEGRDPARKR